MSSTLFGAAFDARDASSIAAFWSAALERPILAGATSDHAVLEVTSPDAGPRLAFHKVPELKTVKNRFHPDLITADLDAETQRLTSLGATILNSVEAATGRWRTFADPEGNEFDVIASS